jgi:16S rRNA (adenine1518-N6/adenine1519-N6)-dimethyltransferase
VRARKRFGQHFLEPAWVEKIVAAIAPAAGDTILEIGPGRGAMTLALARSAGRVVAIEIDRDLAPALASRVPPHVTVVTADFLEADVVALLAGAAPVRVAGNLPYNVASPILFRLLELADGGRRFPEATVMLQLEVAERLAARPGTKAWGVLSACQQLQADVERLFTLPPGAFRPAPQVHSAVVRLHYRAPRVPVRDLGTFHALVRALFSARRKVLSNAVAPLATSSGLDAREVVARAGLDGTRRPETLELAELASLADLLTVR